MFGVIVLILSLIGAFLETLGVSSIVPLVSSMTQMDVLMHNRHIQTVMKLIGISTANELIALLGIGIVLLYVFKNVFFIILSWVRAKYSCKIQRELSVMTMGAYMQHGYDFFLQHSSSELLRGITSDINGVYQILYNGLRLVTEILTILLIGVYICIADWMMAVSVLILSILCLFVIFLFFKKSLRKYGNRIREYDKISRQVSLQVFQGIKEVLVMHRQKYFTERYKEAYIGKQKPQVEQTVAAEAPAYVIEGIIVSGLLGIVCIRANVSTNLNAFIPVLASFAVGAFRILPSLGRVSSSMNQIIFYAPTLYATYSNIKRLREENKGINIDVDSENGTLTFNDTIKVENVCYHYADSSEDVLHDLNLVIHKGESIGLIGQSGAGKSTLMDIILGLHHPQKGKILVDGIDIQKNPLGWSKLIGYVPQGIYLSDTSIRENVAFGIPVQEIDDEKVWDVLKQAQIYDFVKSLPEGINTVIGERGVRFSGGQQQRIAIARALYHNPQILVMDEATSALDNETEAAVMEAVESLQGKITMIIVAHRLTTVKKCDQVYEIKNKVATVKEELKSC